MAGYCQATSFLIQLEVTRWSHLRGQSLIVAFWSFSILALQSRRFQGRRSKFPLLSASKRISS